jgi:taurine dioxygenase
MRELCEQLSSEHTWEPIRESFIAAGGPEYLARAEARFPPRLHRLVRTHPRTGRKFLFLCGAKGAWMQRIVGLHPRESDVLLDYLQRQLDNIEFQVRWRWTLGDLAIWDEPTTNHMGLGDHFAIDPDRIVRSVWAYERTPDE